MANKRIYGRNDTIHHTHHIDVEVSSEGIVQAVWFRCQPLQFKQHNIDYKRKNEMKFLYKHNKIESLNAVELEETK